MSTPNVPIPVNDAIAQPKRPEFVGRVDPFEGLVTTTWIQYLTQQSQQLNLGTTLINLVSFTDQSASIGATDISNGSLGAGFYVFSYYLGTTQAASSTSSLTATLDWTVGGVAQAFTSTAIVNGATTANDSGTKPIWIDGSTPVRYSTTYASTGGTPMKYRAAFWLSRVQT